MKLHFKGHPIHAMLVHFPSALFPTGLIFKIIYLLVGEVSWLYASYYCYASGVLFGWLAALAGMIDVYGLFVRGDQKNLKTALVHGGLNVLVISSFTVIVLIQYKNQYPNLTSIGHMSLVIEVVSILIMIFANYFGAKVYHNIIQK